VQRTVRNDLQRFFIVHARGCRRPCAFHLRGRGAHLVPRCPVTRRSDQRAPTHPSQPLMVSAITLVEMP
jgi:hypothetical protein